MQQMYTSGASSLAHLLGDDDEALPSVLRVTFPPVKLYILSLDWESLHQHNSLFHWYKVVGSLPSL